MAMERLLALIPGKLRGSRFHPTCRKLMARYHAGTEWEQLDLEKIVVGPQNVAALRERKPDIKCPCCPASMHPHRVTWVPLFQTNVWHEAFGMRRTRCWCLRYFHPVTALGAEFEAAVRLQINRQGLCIAICEHCHKAGMNDPPVPTDDEPLPRGLRYLSGAPLPGNAFRGRLRLTKMAIAGSPIAAFLQSKAPKETLFTT